MATFKDFLKSLFPRYYYENDTYKDISGKGLLERFMEVFGDRLDEVTKPDIDDYLINILRVHDDDFTESILALNPALAADKFLKHYAYTLGNPPSITDNDTYRELLRYILPILKVKGTLLSFQVYFRMMGYDVEIIEYRCPPVVRYDENFIYDSGVNYDDGICCTCTEIDIIFTQFGTADCSSGVITSIEQETLDRLYKIVEFLKPIDVKLSDFQLAISLCDSINAQCLDDLVNWELGSNILYDDSHSYDDDFIYDEFTVDASGSLLEKGC